jgi:hypothetical protein
MTPRLLAAAAAFLALSAPAMANCYEILGCDDSDYFTRADLNRLSCQALWEVRNIVYAQNGYCFQTDRGRAMFSNDGCWITDQAKVSLNAYERRNVAAIRAVEQAKGCN